MGNVDPKMGCKIWTPFWGPPNCFFFSRATKRGPDFRHHFGVHIARFFSQHDAQKGHPRVGCEQVRLLHKHIAGTGEDLAQGVGFWYAFLTSFWGPKTMVLSKREGLLPGPGLAFSFWFPFFLELWLLSSCCLGLFSGAILVAIPCLDTGWILAWSFGCLFLLLFWLALSLLSWSLFCSLLLCSWVPGTRVGSLHGRFSSC